jgi:type IV secretion system protein VirB1
MTGCEALAGLALFACVARDPACLPPEHAPLLATLAAIAEQESGFRPFAIRDEATGESLFPATQAEAVRIAAARDIRGHTLGLGWFQITHRANWRRHGLTIATALEPCANLRAGAAHYAADLHAAAGRRGHRADARRARRHRPRCRCRAGA